MHIFGATAHRGMNDCHWSTQPRRWWGVGGGGECKILRCHLSRMFFFTPPPEYQSSRHNKSQLNSRKHLIEFGAQRKLIRRVFVKSWEMNEKWIYSLNQSKVIYLRDIKRTHHDYIISTRCNDHDVGTETKSILISILHSDSVDIVECVEIYISNGYSDRSYNTLINNYFSTN